VLGTVRQSSGHIVVQSAPGKGTRFEAYLPAMIGRVPVPAEDEVVPTSSGPLRVLIVDDDPLVRRAAARALEFAGYEVSCASSAEEAVSISSAGQPIDVLLTDCVTPRTGGQELVRLLRRRGWSARVLLLSGSAVRESVGEGENIAFLRKPFTPEELTRAVGRLLSTSDAGEDDT
jgi:DNA-binding response OmpR family regulator